MAATQILIGDLGCTIFIVIIIVIIIIINQPETESSEKDEYIFNRYTKALRSKTVLDISI